VQQGFVDLRLNGEHSGDESFWPSFTDIMMVIVLIFLLAMVTLLVKNMDLVHKMRSSLAEERAATMQVHSTSDINAQLNRRLQQLEEESAMLNMRLMNLSEEHNRSLAQLKAAEQKNIQLKTGLSAMTGERDTALLEKRALTQQHLELKEALQARDKRLQQKQQELAEQQHQYQLKNEEMTLLKNNNEEQHDRLSKLESEYASLEVKYNKLIRPARSTLGKYVVLVRYRKLNKKLIIEIKSTTDAHYTEVTGIDLHKRLNRLQKKYGKKLYVRIIFPDDSGLSYTEAWNLTESLLRMYDYYYQE